jgi:ferritin-like metal-binding protein YciE
MTLHEMLVDEIRDLYHAEKQMTKALPKMAKAATHEDLREAFEMHLEETQEQINRLEEVFEALGEKPKAKPCPGMAGIIQEGQETMQEDAEGAVLDAALIAAAQRAEHYEIGAYGTCAEWARLLGLNEVVSLLEQTLEEEKAADKKLTMIAEQEINQAAIAEGQSEEGEEGQAAGQTQGGASRGRSSGRTASARKSQSGRRSGSSSGSRRQSSGSTGTRAKAADRRRR